MSFSFSSCSESDPNSPTNETTEVNLEKVTQQYVNDVVFVTYSKLADQLEQLFNKLEALRAKLNAGQAVNQSEIDALCDNYKEARKIWEASEAFFYGAAEEKNIDLQTTHVMPVLNSPLLAIHVSIIMMGYALLAFTFVCSLTSLVLYLLHRQSTDVQQQNIKALQMLSMLFLLPALVALCYGIFIGAYGQIYLGGSIGAGIQKKLGRLLRSWSMLFLCISSIQSISMRLSSITSTYF